MNKKLLIIFGILIILLVLLFTYIHRQKPITECGNQICDAGEDGFNCFIDCCLSGDGLCPFGCTSVNDGDCEKRDLSQVKVAVVYESVTDYTAVGRGVDDVVIRLKETSTDFVFRGFWVWPPCIDSCSDIPQKILDFYLQQGYDCEERGYNYNHLKNDVAELKQGKPGILICGAIPAQRVNFVEVDPYTNRLYKKIEVEEMALDPAKWGVTKASKEELQKRFQNTIVGRGGYFPDITNEDFQEIFLNRARKQIDSGVDAVWVDMLFAQASLFNMATGDPNHPAVKDSYLAASRMVDKIRAYGLFKGRHIYIGTWWNFLELPYPVPDLDFITASPSSEEVLNRRLDETRWANLRELVLEKKLGDIPVFAFIDWADDDAPMAVFSQRLSHSEQEEFLEVADVFFKERGINFVYPVHGGFMGGSAKTLSFSEEFSPGYRFYDSLAPEFQTYDTIKELTQKKASQ